MTTVRLLHVREVAQLGHHPETIRETARKGLIPALKLDGRTSPYRLRQSVIDAHLALPEAKHARRTGWGSE